MIERFSSNAFNGKEIGAKLRQYRDFWLSVIIPIKIQRESLISLPLVKKRLSPYMIAEPIKLETEIYIMADKTSTTKLIQMLMETEVDSFNASEVFVINTAMYDQYCSSFAIEFSRDFIETLDEQGFDVVYAWWD